jgi:hypothetical protein
MTGLHIAAGNNDRAMVDLLLARGTNPALEDSNGARPDQIAQLKGYNGVFQALEPKVRARLSSFVSKMAKFGYLDQTQWNDLLVRRRAISMFQAGQSDLNITGKLDESTFDRADQLKSLKYVYSIRYEKNGQHFVERGAGTFTGVQEARTDATRRCTAAGLKCRFNYAPAGGCIAVVNPNDGAWHNVSTLRTNAAEATEDAMNQCRVERASGCKEMLSLCAS